MTSKHSPSDYLGRKVNCSCGRTHYTDLKTIYVEENALLRLPELLDDEGYRKPFLISDENTEKVAGTHVKRLLEENGINYSCHRFTCAPLLPDERSVGSVLMAYDISCDIIIAVGSGTINDIGRFVSYKLGLPYFNVATAPSMDGFVSTVAAMVTNQMKTTYGAHVPKAIIADLSIMAAAPREMLAAGVGDILGKYTCLADWRLAHLITDEYYCCEIADMVTEARELTLACCHQGFYPALKGGTADLDMPASYEAVSQLTEALVLSGIAMSFAGNSRPASGSEHHLSHFWEMRYLFEGRAPILHGTKVGIGTIVSLTLYSMLKGLKPDFAALKKERSFSLSDWKRQVSRAFLQAAPEVISLEEKAQKNSTEHLKDRLIKIESQWDEIQQVISSLPAPDEISTVLKSLGAAYRPADIGLTPELVKDAIIYAKEVRDRYSVLQLLWDLDLLEAFADKVVKELF